MKDARNKSVIDLLLNVLISIGLSINVFSSFDIYTSLSSNYIAIAAMVIGACAILSFIGINRVSQIIGTITLLVVAFVFVRMTYKEPYFIVLAIVFISSIITYVSTKTRVTMTLYVIACVLVVGAFAFLEYEVSIVAFLIMMFGLVSKYLFLTYSSYSSSSDFGNKNYLKSIAQTSAISVVVISLSMLLFFSVVKPLDPPTREIKLVTKLLSFDVVDKIGVASSVDVPSEQRNEETKKSNKSEDPQNDIKDQKKNEKEDIEKNQIKQQEGIIQNHLTGYLISYEMANAFKYGLVIVLAFLFLIPLIIKRIQFYVRRRKINSMCEKDKIVFLYNYFLKRFSKIGIERNQSYTLKEYISTNEDKLKKFEVAESFEFNRMTHIYSTIVYGGYEPTEVESDLFVTYYDDFMKKSKSYLGTPKFLIKVWSL